MLSSCIFYYSGVLLIYLLLIPDGPQSPCGSVTSAKTLNLRKNYIQTLDHLITSTPAWPLQASPVDSAESYLNLLNLENSSEPAVLVNGDADLFIRANGSAENKEGSCNEIVPFTLRNSANIDEK